MNEVDRIFDAVAEMSCALHRQHAIRSKKKQIRSVTERRCGNCSLWMTSYCRPEKERGQFKSMSSYACADFELCTSSRGLRDTFKAELAELTQPTVD